MLKFLSADEFIPGNPIMSSEEANAASKYLDSDFDFGDFDVKYAYCTGTLIMLYYSEDAGYHFEAPIPLLDFFDLERAYRAITEYCKLQRIPEVIIGIPKEYKNLALRGAKHYNEAEDEDGTLAFEIITECMMEENLPEYISGDVYLGEFAISYASKYEKLVKNVNLNRYFGYNLTDDLPNGKGIDFINFVRKEFENGESMTFAATVLNEDGENEFIGEGVIYGFDGRGTASFSLRVLPEYQRRGYGKKIFLGLLGIAQSLGVDTVFGDVMKENAPSLALVRRFAASEVETSDKFCFAFDVNGIMIGC